MSSGSGRRLLGRPGLLGLVTILWLCAPGGFFTGSGDAAMQDDPPAGEESPESQELTSSEVRFQGNENLGAGELREAAEYELDRFREKGYRRADADDAAYQMELEYRGRGYAFASVDYQYEVAGKKAVVTFVITEGPRVRIDEVNISGNIAFGDDQLRSLFTEEEGLLVPGSTYFIRSEVEDAVSDIRDLYYQEGYLEADIEGPQIQFSDNRERVDIGVSIQEGERYLVKAIEFRGDLPPEAREPLAETKTELIGEPFNRRQSLELRSRIGEIYGNLGYPNVQVGVQQKQREKASQILLEATIRSGPKVRISEIQISGDRETRKSFIRSRLTLEPGDLYSARKQRQSFRALYQTGLFAKVDLSLAEGPDPNQRILKVEVEEMPSRELSAEVGWGSYELLRLRLGFRERNLFGTGRTFRTELGGSTKGADLTANITDPWFLRTDVTADVPLSFKYREEPSFTREEAGASVLFSKQLSRNLSLSLGYNFKLTKLTDVDVDATIDDSDENYTLGSLESQFTFNTRNDIFFPTKGQESYLSGEIADSVLGSQISFLRVTAGTSHYFSLASSTVLALRYITGFIIPRSGQDSIPLGERFFNGGENTVRSFQQDELGPTDLSGDPIGGTAFNVVSAELRHQLRGPFIGTLFVDYGNISPNEPTFGTSESELTSATFDDYFSDWRPAVGVGLQYMLPIGPARLDLAYNPDARVDESDYTVHFSVGLAF